MILKHPNACISSPHKQFPSSRKSLLEKDFALKPPSPRTPHKPVPSIKNASSDKDLILKHSSYRISPLEHIQPERKSLSEKETTPKHHSAIVSPLTNKNVIDSPRILSKPMTKDLKQSTEGTIPCRLVKVSLCFKTWSDAKMLWDSLPSTIHDLGKVTIFIPKFCMLLAKKKKEEVVFK